MEPQLHQSRHSIHVECVVVNICFASNKSILFNRLHVPSSVSGKRLRRLLFRESAFPLTLCPSRIQTTGGRASTVRSETLNRSRPRFCGTRGTIPTMQFWKSQIRQREESVKVPR